MPLVSGTYQLPEGALAAPQKRLRPIVADLAAYLNSLTGEINDKAPLNDPDFTGTPSVNGNDILTTASTGPVALRARDLSGFQYNLGALADGSAISLDLSATSENGVMLAVSLNVKTEAQALIFVRAGGSLPQCAIVTARDATRIAVFEDLVLNGSNGTAGRFNISVHPDHSGIVYFANQTGSVRGARVTAITFF